MAASGILLQTRGRFSAEGWEVGGVKPWMAPGGVVPFTFSESDLRQTRGCWRAGGDLCASEQASAIVRRIYDSRGQMRAVRAADGLHHGGLDEKGQAMSERGSRAFIIQEPHRQKMSKNEIKFKKRPTKHQHFVPI